MVRLPDDILRMRLTQEFTLCRRKLKHEFIFEDPEFNKLPAVITVKMKQTPGPVLKNNKVTHRWSHEFTMTITKEYPYQKPIVRWKTPIFHPNIMLPEDGGYICSRLLDDWDFSKNLLSFIQGVESLLSNPNPYNPYGSQSCLSAAKYFIENEYKPPGIISSTKTGPKIVSKR